jgi:hypothetical protein
MAKIRKQPSPRVVTPLWIVALFISLTQMVLAYAATQTTGGVQIALTVFVLIFPCLIAASFFTILWSRPYNLYPPSEYGKSTDVLSYVQALRREGLREIPVLVHPSRLADTEFTASQGFEYPAKLVGQTTHFHVYAATCLPAQGVQVGQAVLHRCEQDYQQLAAWFGFRVPHFNVIAAGLSSEHDGTGGAYHHACLASDLYCDVQLQPTVNPDLTNALAITQEVEVFGAVQKKGWDCGASNGEGLSRVLANVLYPGVLDGYATAAVWLDGDRPDWVSQTNPSDLDPVSTGCAVLFLYWLNVKLGYGWEQICRAAAPTLAGTYQMLTGKGAGAAFADFKALLDRMFPPGAPSGLAKDNPF